MTPIEIRKTQGNYVNNDAGAYVEVDKMTSEELIRYMDPCPESKEIEDIKQRLNKIEIFMDELRGDMVDAIVDNRDAKPFQDKLIEYASERFDLNTNLTLLRSTS